MARVGKSSERLAVGGYALLLKILENCQIQDGIKTCGGWKPSSRKSNRTPVTKKE